ncbi:hypothetical protein D3C72_1351240 [compost metagenome]
MTGHDRSNDAFFGRQDGQPAVQRPGRAAHPHLAARASPRRDPGDPRRHGACGRLRHAGADLPPARHRHRQLRHGGPRWPAQGGHSFVRRLPRRRGAVPRLGQTDVSGLARIRHGPLDGRPDRHAPGVAAFRGRCGHQGVCDFIAVLRECDTRAESAADAVGLAGAAIPHDEGAAGESDHAAHARSNHHRAPFPG